MQLEHGLFLYSVQWWCNFGTDTWLCTLWCSCVFYFRSWVPVHVESKHCRNKVSCYYTWLHVDMLYLKRKNPLNHLEKRMSFDECKNEYTCTCIYELSFELSLVVKMINILAWDSQLIENQWNQNCVNVLKIVFENELRYHTIMKTSVNFFFLCRHLWWSERTWPFTGSALPTPSICLAPLTHSEGAPSMS